MSAYRSAGFYMLGVVFVEVCLVTTIWSGTWFEFLSMLAVVGPMLNGWRNAA